MKAIVKMNHWYLISNEIYILYFKKKHLKLEFKSLLNEIFLWNSCLNYSSRCWGVVHHDCSDKILFQQFREFVLHLYALLKYDSITFVISVSKEKGKVHFRYGKKKRHLSLIFWLLMLLWKKLKRQEEPNVYNENRKQNFIANHKGAYV